MVKATENFSISLKYGPADPYTHRARGDAYWGVSEWDKAVADYRVAKKAGKMGDSWCFYAYAAQRSGHLEEAEFAASKAIEGDQDIRLYILRGQIREKRSDIKGAISDARHAISKAKGGTTQYNNLKSWEGDLLRMSEKKK